jgi:phage repressor protein C with HTH and peptisase S24 domain
MAETRVPEQATSHNWQTTEADVETAEMLSRETRKAREHLAHTLADGSTQASVEVFDNSMQPTFSKGDIAYLDGAGSVHGNGIYAFHHQGKPHIKRLQQLTGGNIRIISDSKEQPSITVCPEDLDIVGRVVYAWRRM